MTHAQSQADFQVCYYHFGRKPCQQKVAHQMYSAKTGQAVEAYACKRHAELIRRDDETIGEYPARPWPDYLFRR